jgi:hypothetical protein
MATKWGVLSAGKISHDFVGAVRSLPESDHQVSDIQKYFDIIFKNKII